MSQRELPGRRTPTTEHNYMVKQLHLLQLIPLQPGTVNTAAVAHDDWCDALNDGGYCNCDPDIRFVRLAGDCGHN